MNAQIGLLLNMSLESLRGSNFESAEFYLKQVLELQSSNPDALRLLGVLSAQRKEYSEAIGYLNAALDAMPNNALAWSNLGNIYLEIRGLPQALDAYQKSIAIDPQYVEAWSNMGNALFAQKRYEEALDYHHHALSLDPNYVQAYSNAGNALNQLSRFEEAIASYDQALSLQPHYHEALTNKGMALYQLKRYDEAIASYDQALSLQPHYYEALTNKGTALYQLKRYDEGIFYYDQALSLNPNYHEAWFNKGVALHELKHYDESIFYYDQALNLKSDYHEAWANKASALYHLRRYEEAIFHYDKALNLKSNIDWLYGDFLHTKMRVCQWAGHPQAIKKVQEALMEKKKIIQPFPLLAISDDPILHRTASEIYAAKEHPLNPVLGEIPRRTKKDKIRIGYFSPDFCTHPVAFLTAELFERHDRSKFEVIGFSLLKTPDGDEMRMRLKDAFDVFIDVEHMSDMQIAKIAREMELDIAIDLSGPTLHSRMRILAHRAAPIQVNWLGYPGTFGTTFIDYIIADEVIIPEGNKESFVEKIIYLPKTYMVDDSKRLPSSRIFTRAECGLPENRFVFCCFNNDYKFNIEVLDLWAKILLKAPDSVLWISENNEFFRKNILKEFAHRGVMDSRIIFANRVDLISDHLSRLGLADLFLDTFPYNAHSTAVDSLKAGVPLITLLGKSFAGRVAASLLTAVGLSDLIATTSVQYEQIAYELFKDKEKLLMYKKMLLEARLNGVLFDSQEFAKNIEASYLMMYKRYHEGLAPKHMKVGK